MLRLIGQRNLAEADDAGERQRARQAQRSLGIGRARGGAHNACAERLR